MANVCRYKIKVIGRKSSCYALINMMPLYVGEKEILFEEGTDDDYTLIFKGDCKWGIDYGTDDFGRLEPFTEEEIEEIEDGDYWDFMMVDKAFVLGVEIFCNTLDDDGQEIFYHYIEEDELYGEEPEDILKF